MPNETWRPLFQRISEQGYKVTAIRRSDGIALDLSPAWEGCIAGMKPQLMGHGHFEFMRAEDIDGLLAFGRSDDPLRTTFTYPTIMLGPDNRRPMELALAKINVGPVAICVGATAIIEREALTALGYCDLAKSWVGVVGAAFALACAPMEPPPDDKRQGGSPTHSSIAST